MSVANDLQNLTADISAAIAGRATYGRADLEILRRKVETAAREAGELERSRFTHRHSVETLCDAIDERVIDLSGLTQAHRAQLAKVA